MAIPRMREEDKIQEGDVVIDLMDQDDEMKKRRSMPTTKGNFKDKLKIYQDKREKDNK